MKIDVDILPASLTQACARQDIEPLASTIRIRFQADLPVAWQIAPGNGIVFGPRTLQDPDLALRHALETDLLRQLYPSQPVLAGLAAARTAALFHALEQTGGTETNIGAADAWLPLLAGTLPSLSQLAKIWPLLHPHQPDAPGLVAATDHAALTRLWPLLGPAEYLMQTGGDQRLRLDPSTGLNAYGCSHRPRPWAITYASSTASSSSARGYNGAEACRLRLLTALDPAHGDHAGVLAAEAEAVRRDIAAWYGVTGTAGVVLAASGTDCEIFALALAQMHPSARPVTNILIAPEETGSGVPLAAAGRHFAHDTSCGSAVTPDTLIEGFNAATLVAGIPVRSPQGDVIAPDTVASACATAVASAVGRGARALVHLLDLSKTGLLSPGPDAVSAIAAQFGDDVDVVVDACQARLSPERVRDYLARGWIVLVTGSKFFTGPPFCGAMLLPPAMLARLDHGALPAGLHAYAARAEWPARPATAGLRDQANTGLLLRWRAALAEMEAFARVPASSRAAIIALFTAQVRAGIDANPDLIAIDMPLIKRSATSRAYREGWDGLETILSFALRDPMTGRRMDIPQTRDVYRWLNADLTPVLTTGLSPAEREICRKHIHIGQPAPLTGPDGGRFGALRISAGARLVSGEPAHDGLGTAVRVASETADALAVLTKISVILRCQSTLQDANPQARFR